MPTNLLLSLGDKQLPLNDQTQIYLVILSLQVGSLDVRSQATLDRNFQDRICGAGRTARGLNLRLQGAKVGFRIVKRLPAKHTHMSRNHAAPASALQAADGAEKHLRNARRRQKHRVAEDLVANDQEVRFGNIHVKRT